MYLSIGFGEQNFTDINTNLRVFFLNMLYVCLEQFQEKITYLRM